MGLPELVHPAPNSSSILELNSVTKGFLAPRMTKAQRDAIVNPAVGLMIYQTNNTAGYYFWSGTSMVVYATISAF
jgi:hypothetical protein